MSTTTTNYGLVKPELTDAADITAMNGNWDTIDTELQTLNDTVENLDAYDVGALPVDDVGGVHNLRFYTSFSQIGLTVGSETIESICEALPKASILETALASSSNASIYPSSFGVLRVTKLANERIAFELVTKQETDMSNSYKYYGFAFLASDVWYWTGWIENGNPASYLPLDGSVPMTGTLQYTDGTNTYDYYGEHNKPTAEDVGAYTKEEVDEAISAIPTPDVSGQIEEHNTSETAHEGMFAPAYTYGTTDLTAGTSELETGTLYFVYE